MPSLLSKLLNNTWTIGDILYASPDRMEKAGMCNVELKEVLHELKKEQVSKKFETWFFRRRGFINVYYVTFVFSVTSDTGTNHKVYIKVSPDVEGQLYTNNRVRIYCSCKDFTFNSAWELEQHEALFRTQRTDITLGSAVTNAPKKKKGFQGLCKHAYAALSYLVNNYSYLMSNL